MTDTVLKKFSIFVTKLFLWKHLHCVSNFKIFVCLFLLYLDSDLIVCSCNHLTNFGIIFDWTGSADAKDPGDEINPRNKSNVEQISISWQSIF